ncbi:MAG: hypothetical protein WD872_21760 [Pirellulaceae bacterium]
MSARGNSRPGASTPTQVSRAWIGGRKVELNDRHKRLYRKYEEKYDRLDP